MDVTFFEETPFYSNSAIQWENNTNEMKNWDWTSLLEPSTLSHLPSTLSSSSNTPISVPVLDVQTPMIQPKSPSNTRSELPPIVYPKHLLLLDDVVIVYEIRKNLDLHAPNQQNQETLPSQAEPERL